MRYLLPMILTVLGDPLGLGLLPFLPLKRPILLVVGALPLRTRVSRRSKGQPFTGASAAGVWWSAARVAVREGLLALVQSSAAATGVVPRSALR